MENKQIRCDFCAHRCVLAPGQLGRCGIRENRGGTLLTTTYGQIVAAAVDPIEKKPLFHFYPGSTAFSVALAGCNFRCRFCQNASLAFPELFERDVRRWTIDELLSAWRSTSSPTIAYTYSEPGVWQDFLLDTARPAVEEGARIAMVTNGFLTAEAADRLVDVVDAFNIDLKGDERFYRTLCHAHFDPVVATTERIARTRHVEVTTMLIESTHSVDLLERLADQLARAGVKVWHLSRFHPAWKMHDEPRTSEGFIKDAVERVRERWNNDIPFIYVGNSRQSEYLRTACPRCGRLCVERNGRVIDHTIGGRCPSCDFTLYGRF